MDVDAWLARHRTHRLACVSAAERRTLALLRTPAAAHLWLPEHNGAKPPADIRVHRARPIEPAPTASRIVSVPDMLEQVSTCLAEEEAMIVWESALHLRLVTKWQLLRIPWRNPRARALAVDASDLSESLLETLVLHRLRRAGLEVRQQVRILGRRVDFLVAGALVVQTDGFEHHSDPIQRGSDIEHDARLLLNGRPVIRLDYHDVVDDWELSEARIVRATTVFREGVAAP